ncbi:hypothetical protein HDU76_000293, partial [Blyttiomyces sp. JEL0837]
LLIGFVFSASSTGTPVFHKSFPDSSSLDLGLFQYSGCDSYGDCTTKSGCLKYSSSRRRASYPTKDDFDALCSSLTAGQAFTVMADLSAVFAMVAVFLMAYNPLQFNLPMYRIASYGLVGWFTFCQFVEMCIVAGAKNNKLIQSVSADYGPSLALSILSWMIGAGAIATLYLGIKSYVSGDNGLSAGPAPVVTSSVFVPTTQPQQPMQYAPQQPVYGVPQPVATYPQAQPGYVAYPPATTGAQFASPVVPVTQG